MCRTDYSLRVAKENRRKIKALILAHGLRGISMPNLKKQTGFGRWTLQQHIAALTVSGEIERSSETGHAVRYGAPGIWEAHADIRERSAQQAAKYGKAYEAVTASEAWANHVPVHAVVPANEAPKIEKRGPASVWELAA